MADIPELPEPQPIPPGAGRLARWQPVLTLVIAITAIGLAVWEGLADRRHNRLSVIPRLGAEMYAGSNAENEFVHVGIESNGLGPAVITAFRVYFDGELQDDGGSSGATWHAVQRAVEEEGGIDMNAQAFGAGYFLPPGREEVIFEATRPRAAEGTPGRLADIFGRLAIHICYCSVYETDCGEIDTKEDLEKAACPVPSDDDDDDEAPR